jgi:hypothetical protein
MLGERLGGLGTDITEVGRAVDDRPVEVERPRDCHGDREPAVRDEYLPVEREASDVLRFLGALVDDP